MDFTFVHLSDLHFSTTPSHVSPLSNSDRSRLYKAAWILGWKRPRGKSWALPTTYDQDVAVVLAQTLAAKVAANNAIRSLDGIIVTGDIATTGNEKDLEVAKNFLTGKLGAGLSPSDLQSGFINLMDSIPVAILPGNHDRYSDCFLTRSRNFEARRAFGPAWCGGYAHISEVKADGNCDRLRYRVHSKDSERLILIQADFSLGNALDANSVPGILGQGYAHNNTIKRLQRLTGRLRDKYRCQPVVWLTHFPPEVEVEEKLMIRFGERLSKAAGACNVNYILAGHIHSHKVYSPPSEKNVNIICSGSATDPEGVPSFNEIVFSISGGKITSCTYKIYVYDRGAFVPMTTPPNGRCN